MPRPRGSFGCRRGHLLASWIYASASGFEPEPNGRLYTWRSIGRNYFLAPAQASARFASSETDTPSPVASRTTLLQLGLRRPHST
jgi:hypothetical protein